MLPNFLIVGAAKAGTTALAAYLGAHPEVFLSEEKELHFFDHHYARGVDWYAQQFRPAHGEIAVGEATPTYLFDESAVDRMASVVPQAKLVVILRNPVDRAYSHYWWMRALTERLPFEEAVRAEIADPDKRKYLAAGRYLPQLERMCSVYPRSSVHVMILEDMRSARDEEYARVCRFLGVDDVFRPANLGTTVNEAYRLRWPRLRWALYKMHAWRRFPRLSSRIDRWNRVPLRYPTMSPSLRAELEELFAEHNSALAAWLGRDLSVWNARANA